MSNAATAQLTEISNRLSSAIARVPQAEKGPLFCEAFDVLGEMKLFIDARPRLANRKAWIAIFDARVRELEALMLDA